jgi:predicted CDP-diglyceride synthetase/phosphatidate cytidylyltransferase
MYNVAPICIDTNSYYMYITPICIYLYIIINALNGTKDQGLNKNSKVHWSKTSEHQESTGPEYRNEGNKMC